MKYVKAAAVLPEELLQELQKYVQGELLYIPKRKENHEQWGSRSGGRKQLDERNEAIRLAYKGGKHITQLSQEYFLSVDTIKRIVYAQ
ncbi:CD3324 family protein [Ectobacillus antri]|jgi:DNA-binding NarL/FixJ family response regulator|uniref:CD3324 family protein n=1 Tax=Ectobacillus antri TaxID=2486280 RepID=A0ABT6H134_9BACI|nr:MULTISPECIES: CD3324 family protein [Ectobacillus]MDG4656312.1 CD3324 family protein [Ectobacillus antri]MDG5752987.1 CD3324 family protein [Ectobacillus antri]UOY92825.1 CD3324 family protein [Ectobacillus sp. JY-23]